MYSYAGVSIGGTEYTDLVASNTNFLGYTQEA